MAKEIPQDMQDVINEVSTTESGRGDLGNQYKINDTLLDDALADANIDVTITNTSIPITTNEGLDVLIKDEYGFEAELTPLNEIRTCDKHRLCGCMFAGTTPDAGIYTTVLTGSSTATITDRLLTLATGTTLNSTARIETITTGQYTASNSNMARLSLKVGDLGTTNNIRRWGATLTTDGFFFYLNGTTFGVGYRKNSIETYITQTNFNGDKTFVLDTNLNAYEIYYTTTKVYFTINSKLVHTLSATTVPLIANFNLKPAITNVNSNGLTTNCTISVTAMSLNRFGPLITNPFYRNLTGASTTTLKQSAGRLHSLIINGAGQTGQTVTIYDNISATGTKIATIDVSKIPSPMVLQYNTYGIAFSTGLTLVTVGSAVDITVIYE